ncbi:hypothetical protein ECANGB1_1803 [Enterospora canceri]|uniref:Uncharacterized protein n=1 Tax=Enterospora canceri TaxID=1081671 RepID=A0A1Y1S5E8_9MICR|nr:hypothetical protein ECANGB1_1803 [Enterospora canceri]
MNLAYCFVALKAAYRHNLWEFDANVSFLKLKQAQLILEAATKTCVMYPFKIFLNDLDKLKEFGFKDNTFKANALVGYNIFRMFILGGLMNIAGTDYTLFVVAFQAFDISEAIGIILISMYVLYLIEWFKKEIKEQMIVDKFGIERLLKSWKMGMCYILIAMILEIIYRITFIQLSSMLDNDYTQIAKEVTCFIRIFSNLAELYGISLMIFITDKPDEDDFEPVKKKLNENKHTDKKQKEDDSSNISVSEFKHLVGRDLKI